MSKVHEALKRAEEERSSAAPGNVDARAGAEATAALFAAKSEVLSPAVTSSGAKASVRMEVAEISDVSATAMKPAPERVEVTAPAETIPKPPSVIFSSEHRPHIPSAGRDPRTGQFLRFEDLLKNCAKPTWVLDPRTVAFSGANEALSGTEQFRTLRSRLYNLRETSPLKRILITSALASEGKTFVATNLAQAIAKERERKVLLIDGDLRSPSLHKPLGAPATPGLSDYLRAQASDPEIIQHGQEGNLCFIAAGNPGSDPRRR